MMVAASSPAMGTVCSNPTLHVDAAVGLVGGVVELVLGFAVVSIWGVSGGDSPGSGPG